MARMCDRLARVTPLARARVAELKRIYLEGQAAELGAANPYHGQTVLASVWRAGYRRMLDDAIANSPAMQAYLRRGAGRQMAHSGRTALCAPGRCAGLVTVAAPKSLHSYFDLKNPDRPTGG